MSGQRELSAPLPLDLPDARAPAPDKSPQAFRTISEVGDELDIPAHVLRFWETKFPQLSPMKRGGGRRYYRPSDVALLRGIRVALYDEGLTIKGLQKLLRERGARHVAALGDGTGAVSVSAPAPASAPAALPEAAPGDIEALIARLAAVRDKLRGG